NEQNDALEWVGQQRKKFTAAERTIMDNQIDYLGKSDDLLATYLTDNDLKIALIISNKRGYGTEILNHFIKESQAKGKDSIYLWTDSSCNHGYYPKWGFEEILCVDNANANSFDEAYRTLFYCKKI